MIPWRSYAALAFVVISCAVGSKATAENCVIGAVVYVGKLCSVVSGAIKSTPKLKASISILPLDNNAWSCPHISYLSQARSGLFKDSLGHLGKESVNAEISRDAELPIRLFGEENMALTIAIAHRLVTKPENSYLVFLSQGGRFFELPLKNEDREPVTLSVFARISDLCLQDENYLFIVENAENLPSMLQYEMPKIVGWFSFSKRQIADLIEKRRMFYRNRFSDLALP